MFALPGTLALIFFLYIRPQEFIQTLQLVPFLYLFLGAALLGLAVDIRLRLTRPTINPVLPLVIAFVVWCAVTVGLKAPDRAIGVMTGFLVPIIIYVCISQGIQSFKGIQLLAGVLLGMTLFLSFVGIHQGFASRGCVILDPDGTGDLQAMEPDGRGCEKREECFEFGAEPGQLYLCENVGLFGTNSVAGGRVRWRGILQDPNELALAIGSTLPFAFAFLGRRRNMRRFYLLILSLFLVSFCIIMTKSRGGILVFMVAVGVYAFRKYGGRGVMIGAVLGAPLLLLGGRGGGEASKSSEERYEAWRTGLDLFRSDPVFGVGLDQFTEYHYLTAHNSYVLTMAELGFVGMFLWVAIFYLSVKIIYLGLRRYSASEQGKVASDWGIAMVAAMGGTAIGILFLSMAYHPMVWIYFGMCGAYWQSIRRHDPSFKVTMGPVDWIGIAGGCAFFIMFLFVYLKLKGV